MQRSSVGRALIWLFVLAGVAMAVAIAQTAPYTFRKTVRRVVVDVVVTDGQHHMIHGLKKRDFRIYEDNREQDLRSFNAYYLDGDQAYMPPRVPPLPPNTFMDVPNGPERGPLYVIVYDALNMGDPDDQITNQVFARKQLAQFLQSKPEGTRFELYYLGDEFRLMQGFTTDKQKLLDAFDVHRKEGHIPWAFLYGANYGSGDLGMAFEVMTFVAKNLEGLPGRKNLIWLSGGFPVPLAGPGFDIASAPNGFGISGGAHNGAANGFGPAAGSDMATVLQEELMREATDTLNFAQVSVYPIDVTGLNPNAAWGGINSLADQVANSTGGKAYFNRNDILQAIQDATENGGSYYEMTYEPPSHNFDGNLHHIQVKLSKPGYQLEYRQYYFDDDPEKPLTKEEKRYAEATAGTIVAHHPGDTLYAYMVQGAPMAHDVLFRAQVHAGETKLATAEQMADLQQQPAYFVLRKRNKPVKVPPPIPLQPYTIDYLVMDETAAARGGRQVLEFAACAYDEDGRMLNGLSQYAERAQGKGTQKASNSPAAKPLFRAEQTLQVPTAAKWLRIAVRDVATDRIGTIEIRLPLEQPPAGTQQAGR